MKDRFTIDNRFEEVFNIKENAIETLIRDNCVINAILGKDVDSPVENPHKMLYTRIFPYKKAMQNVVPEKTAFITMDYAATGLSQSKFKDGVLTFYVIVHEDFMRMSLGRRNVVRTDYLVSRIDRAFNSTRGFGLGTLQFGGMRTVEFPTNWEGTAIIYETINLN